MPDRKPDAPKAPPIEYRLGALRWPVMRRLGVHPSGEERSRGLGAGLEYADAREYVPGDDPRQIDWSLSARSGRTFVRLAHPDRGLDAWLLVDTSRSLDWGTSLCLKREAAADLVAVGKVLPPSSGRRSRSALMAEARRAPGPGEDGPTDLAVALTTAARIIRRPSLLLVVSDFQSPPGWQLHLRALSLKHEVVAAMITDPREQAIPDVGLVTFEDPETGRQLEVDTRSSRLRDRFQRAAAERQAQLRAEILAAGAFPIEVTTSEDVLGQLIRLLRSIAAQARWRPGARVR